MLHDHYLGRDRPIGEARLLWEISEQGKDVRRLCERLGLDSGYVSRLLRSLETEGLVTVEPQSQDPRGVCCPTRANSGHRTGCFWLPGCTAGPSAARV